MCLPLPPLFPRPQPRSLLLSRPLETEPWPSPPPSRPLFLVPLELAFRRPPIPHSRLAPRRKAVACVRSSRTFSVGEREKRLKDLLNPLSTTHCPLPRVVWNCGGSAITNTASESPHNCPNAVGGLGPNGGLL